MWLKPKNRPAAREEAAPFAHVAEKLRRGGEPSQAVAVCQDGLRRFPDHVSARVTLGWALLDLGRFDEAQQELQQALRRAPDNLLAIRGLAHLHQHTDGGEFTHGTDAHDEQSWFDRHHGEPPAAETTPVVEDTSLLDEPAVHMDSPEPVPAPMSRYHPPEPGEAIDEVAPIEPMALPEEPAVLEVSGEEDTLDVQRLGLNEPASVAAPDTLDLINEDLGIAFSIPSDTELAFQPSVSLPSIPALDEEPMSEEALLRLEAMMEDAETVPATFERPMPVERPVCQATTIDVGLDEPQNGFDAFIEDPPLHSSVVPAIAVALDEPRSLFGELDGVLAPQGSRELDAVEIDEAGSENTVANAKPYVGGSDLGLFDEHLAAAEPLEATTDSRAVEAGLQRFLKQVRNRRLLLG